ncbi:type VII secretion integral membrane protein EccD [Sinosporangium album]|uniref:Type VII secretion integral membrane protein EccD n=1 Tax=Sinosporangium album TaxID=504805 RepID=A0A1G7YXG4_9ACTN|nr:type VII secretion integral membrane protein EccD [Sinosporangium album]SDH00946.1 type VII secretion integral membrane protein EccD [Sinosporangium album]
MATLAQAPQGPIQPGAASQGPVQQGPVQQGALPQSAPPLTALCHVTIVAPRKRADLALPADIPLPHVLPALLRAVGEIDGESAAAPGWVLQRPGGTPFDLGQSLGALGVLDGEILYLLPRDAALPPALFDDVADVVATGVKEGTAQWTGAHTRRLGVGGSCALLTAGALGLVLGGPPWGVTAIVAGVLAVLLVVVAAIMSRSAGAASAGTPIGYTALPYGFLAGLFAPAGANELSQLGAPSLLAAFACTTLIASFSATLVGQGGAGFLGTAIASVVGVVGSAAVMLFDAPGAGVAAVAVTVLVALGPLIPTLAFRLARLPMPTMPTNAEELREDNQKLDSPVVLARTRHAQTYVTGMIVGTVLVVLGTQLLLLANGGWIALLMTLTLSLTMLLRARVFHGVGQRLWLLGGGLAGPAMLALTLSGTGGGSVAIGVGVGLLWIAMLVAGLGIALPSARLSPFWGRAGDIVDVLLIVQLFPAALGVLEVYTWVRGLSG